MNTRTVEPIPSPNSAKVVLGNTSVDPVTASCRATVVSAVLPMKPPLVAWWMELAAQMAERACDLSQWVNDLPRIFGRRAPPTPFHKGTAAG